MGDRELPGLPGHAPFDPMDATVDVSMVMGGVPELVGTLLRNGHVVGAVPGTPAAKLSLDELAERTGLPVDWAEVEKLRLASEFAVGLGEAAATPRPFDASHGAPGVRRDG